MNATRRTESRSIANSTETSQDAAAALSADELRSATTRVAAIVTRAGPSGIAGFEVRAHLIPADRDQYRRQLRKAELSGAVAVLAGETRVDPDSGRRQQVYVDPSLAGSRPVKAADPVRLERVRLLELEILEIRSQLEQLRAELLRAAGVIRRLVEAAGDDLPSCPSAGPGPLLVDVTA